jgi:hypothetical protein
MNMPYVQELCRVRLWWLQPGHVCVKSKLGLNDYAQRNVVARYALDQEPLCTPLSKEASLSAVLYSNSRFLLESNCARENPLVKVRIPVTLFEFDLLDTTEGWLLSELVQSGAEAMFGKHLDELENVALYLANRGQGTDRGVWGTSVSFHCLWVFKQIQTPKDTQISCEFGGYVDLTRVPLGLFAEKPELQQRSSKPASKVTR